MLNDGNIGNEVSHLLAAANNLLMRLNFSGDDVHEAADIMRRCHLIFNYLNPRDQDGKEEDNGEVNVGVGESSGSND